MDEFPYAYLVAALGKRSTACDADTMGKKGKKGQAGKPKKLTPKDISKRLDALVKKLEEELEGADLFVPPPPMDDCPICLVRLSRMQDNSTYQVCCGKYICNACFKDNLAFVERKKKNADKKQIIHTCPLCREPLPSEEEILHLGELRASQGDPVSLSSLGNAYTRGQYGLHRNELKALDYWIRAVEVGSADACTAIAIDLRNGIGLSANMEKAALFATVGAIRGDVKARSNIGFIEYYDIGNHELGIRHWKIAAEAGSQPALDCLKGIYNANGKRPGKEFISKEDMDRIYRAGHKAQEMVKTEEREKHYDTEDKMKC